MSEKRFMNKVNSYNNFSGSFFISKNRTNLCVDNMRERQNRLKLKKNKMKASLVFLQNLPTRKLKG